MFNPKTIAVVGATVLKQEGRKRIIGIGRLIVEPGQNSGEYVVLVHDDHHGKGLGYKLVDMLIGVAQDKGLDKIYGIVLSRNEKMLRVARKLGFTTTLQPDGVDRVELVLR
jgi:acetyltransferase